MKVSLLRNQLINEENASSGCKNEFYGAQDVCKLTNSLLDHKENLDLEL
jgi:hypothetical protein